MSDDVSLLGADEPDDEFVGRLQATEGLLKAHKFEHAQMVRDAQAGGEGPSIKVMAEIAKLEVQVSNLKSFLRCRNLSRRYS